MFTRRSFLKQASVAAAVGSMTLYANTKAQANNSMTGMETIMSRRSVREYTEQEISPKQIETLLKAAMQAPSAGNDQPWEFLVITDKAKLNEVATIKKGVKMAKGAPLGILTCYNTNLESDSQKGFAVQSVACATQNILLAAHAMGLGGVWTSAYPKQSFVDAYRKLFTLPENIIPVAFVVIGHPKAKPEAKNDFKPERIHTNVW